MLGYVIGLFQRFAVLRTSAAYMAAACSLITSLLATPVEAAEPRIVPDTKLRVSVIQWMPTKGVYEQWAALSGEFVVTQDATIELPVVGSVPIGELGCIDLASEIAGRLQSKLGFVEKPETRVEVVEFPPIYVVGDIMTSGQYRFRAGLTALHALALGGGVYRSPVAERRSENPIRLAGELGDIGTDIIRTNIRIERLEAEMSGAPDFPVSNDTPGRDDKVTVAIIAQEKAIFLARAKELDRQTRSLVNLRDLLNAEIDVLQDKIKGADADIQLAEEELASVTKLVDKGLAVVSRKTEVARALTGYRTDRLDQVTALMRARQGVADATRNMEGLRDKQQTEIASQLQQERAKLDQLGRKQEMSRKLLFDAFGSAAPSSDEGLGRTVSFTIVRRENGESHDISALESTPLLPGDIVKVTVSPSLQSTSASVPLGSISDAGNESEAMNR
jgi:protein involved in polysaccharide export with SLBB domain